jgi:hypothetical protein
MDPIFLPARFILLAMALANLERYDSRFPCRQNLTTSTSAASNPRDTLAHFPALTDTYDTNPKSGQVPSGGNGKFSTISDKTTSLPPKTENFTQSTGNSVAWVNVSDLTITPTTTISLYYGNLTVSTRQNAEEVSSFSDLLYGAGDLRGVADAGTAARKELS